MPVLELLLLALACLRGAWAVIGGYSAVEGQFPYAVSVQREIFWTLRSRVCEGSLVSSSWVLSVAQCFNDTEANLVVVAGTLHLYPWLAGYGEQTRRVQRIVFLYPVYEEVCPSDAALALLRLAEPMELSDVVRPVQLPPPGFRPPLSRAVQVAGWGVSSLLFRQLRYGVLYLLSPRQCPAPYLLCTGPLTGGFGPCQEPGSALTQEPSRRGPSLLVGVTVWPGGTCGAANRSATYINLALFSSYIRHTIAA